MFNHKHFIGGPDDSLIEHEGDRDTCTAPECEWPWVGAMVTTLTKDSAEITGVVKERTDSSVRLCTMVGEWFFRPIGKVWPSVWGTYCPHGLRIVEAIPAEHTCEQPQPPCDMQDDLFHHCLDHRQWCRACYPDGRKVHPWPCGEDGCTEADFDREQQEQIDAYYEEMHQSYYG